MPFMNKALILLSGGMDSTTLLFYVRNRLAVTVLDTVTFAYGQRHRRELAMAAWQARAAGVRDHSVIDVPFLGNVTAPVSALTGTAIAMPDPRQWSAEERCQPATYVPHRNLVLLSLAAACAEARGIQDIYYGAQAQDNYGYWDCAPDFIQRINRVLALNRRNPVRVHAPFAAMRKVDELRLGLKLGVDYAHTWTCYLGGRKPCAACPACRERRAAFDEAGIADPLQSASSK